MNARAASPLAETILQGKAPQNVRLAAARGAIPLDRPELLRVMITLSRDGDAQVREAAAATLGAWPREELEGLAADPGTHPETLVHLLRDDSAGPSILPALLSNPALPLDALEDAVPGFNEESLDALLLNQTLLIQNPGLLGRVDANPAATALQRSRAGEIRRHFIEVHEAPAPQAEPAPEAVPDGSPEPEPAPDTPSAAPETGGETVSGGPGETAPARPPSSTIPTPEEAEKTLGAYERILKLNVTQKIALAVKGDKEERGILIRDSNRSVQEAVIGSPKLTLREVEDISRMRNVNEEILRRITRRRDWMKCYAVVLGLVTNPKTPPGISLSLLSRLTTKDLKFLARDKNIPDALRRNARKKLEARERKPGGGH